MHNHLISERVMILLNSYNMFSVTSMYLCLSIKFMLVFFEYTDKFMLGVWKSSLFFRAPSGLRLHLGRRPRPWSVTGRHLRFSPDPVSVSSPPLRVFDDSSVLHTLVVVGRRFFARPLHHALHRHGRAPRRREPLAPAPCASTGGCC